MMLGGLMERYKIETIKITLQVKEGTTKKVDCPGNTVEILKGIYQTLDVDQEHFTILALDNALNIRGEKVLFSGSETMSNIDSKIIFRTLLLMGAVAFIICHNHPAGNASPSIDDISITNRIKDGANLLGLRFLDHIILGDGEFFSFQDKNLV